MNRVYGASAAGKAVFAGLVVGTTCSLIRRQIMLQGYGFIYLALAIRIAIALATGFLLAQLLNIVVFNQLGD